MVKELKTANDPSIKPLSVSEGSEVGELWRQPCIMFIMLLSMIARMGISIAVQPLTNVENAINTL